MRIAIAAFCLLVTAISAAQGAARTGPPVLEPSSGGFTIRRLAGPVAIDGKEWFAAQPNIGGEQVVNASAGQFAVKVSRQRTSNMGNSGSGRLEEIFPFQVLFSVPGDTPVPLVPLGTYALVAGNRWIFTDPLDVTDARTWRRFDLSKQFGIESLVKPLAVSANGTRIVFSRNGCTSQCKDSPDEYFEIGLPPPDTPKTDLIGALIARLAATRGMWINGTFTPIELPADAPTARLVEAALGNHRYDFRKVSTHRIIETREVPIEVVGPERYRAVLVETDLGMKVVLLSAGQMGWWNRVYDE